MRTEWPGVRLYTLVAGFALGLFASEAMAGGPPVLVGSTSGEDIRSVLIAGNFAYCSMSYGLLILDMSNPASPTYVSRLVAGDVRPINPPGHYRAVLQGTLLYLPAFNSGVLIIDVSDPYNPTLKTTIAFPTSVTSFKINEPYMYVCGVNQPLYTLDISDIQNPVVMDSTLKSYTMFDYVLDGSYLYIIGYYLYAFDVSDPAHPQEVFQSTETAIAVSLAKRGNYLFMADMFRERSGGLEGIGVYELTDPSSPLFVSSLGYHANDLDAQPVGNFVYMVHSGGGGLHAVNVSDPANPVMAECFTVGSLPECVSDGGGIFPYASSVSIIDGYAYMSTFGGLYVYTLESRGDCNDDGIKNSSDIIWLVNFVFRSGTPPVVLEQGNVECLGGINTADIIYLVNFIFKGGDPPVCP